MKFSPCLAVLVSLAAAALHRPNWPKRHFGDQEITDPNVLAELQTRHARLLANMRDNEVIYMHTDEAIGYLNSPLQKRLVPPIILGILGIDAFVEVFSELGGYAADIAAGLQRALDWNDHAIWTDPGHCRVFFQTHAGSELTFKTWNISSDSDSPDTNWNDHQPWIDPHSNPPPVIYFDSPFIGTYSVQFTATDQVAWSGIDGTEKCVMQGICNPQYVFYRNGYNILINTWHSQGEVSKCQYSDGEECGGLCSSGVLDQFSRHGNVWGGCCAVPCIWDGPDGDSM
ncbi:hypothetical protein Aspvir_007193 [Aspergillus viridinutans]|uniref:Uncharacterized protein n=1 Tax=Aspergillus viridinutans TaxID=75553 RepID=A0A9P3BVS1_ASPVI|nr:uncharacterized protein Aspvir_007193 [Aspergillus viridinutans]GIK03124.1 hypothetical protein Aspvir_007193 [Aspergillus viridinutans]